MLADGGSGVRVDQEGVGDFDLRQKDLVQFDGTADVRLGAGAPLSTGEVIHLVLLLRGKAETTIKKPMRRSGHA